MYVTLLDNPPPSDTDDGASGAFDEPVGKVGDKVFFSLSFGAAALILVTLAAVAFFLFAQGLPTFTSDSTELDGDASFFSYVGPLVFGTIYISCIALLLATPIAIAVALYISHYAPRKIAKTLGYFIDLLAAIPSVVYGLWGIIVLAPVLSGSLFPWLRDNLGFLPFFGSDVAIAQSGRSTFTVGVVLAVMVLPIITAISREVFLQTPRLHEEASLALGATRWEVIRQAVIPYGRSGVISGAMLGLGRALGETMAVAIILSPARGYFWDVLTAQNSNSIASNIALQFPESSGLEVNRLIATGLVLFILTFVVNAIARRASNSGFSGADG
ncbi:MAG: phosphate transport system permease protein [Candidatus Aldehydirespiratoraceae bacterium]